MSVSVESAIAEGGRIVGAAGGAEIELKLTGGIAIAKICPSAKENPALRREYSDIDFIGRSGDAGDIELFFDRIGYRGDSEFNSLHGEHRLYFADMEGGREADVFLDEIRACHVLDLRDRLDIWPDTVAPADLLLSKLQVVQTNPKDYQDIFAILLDHDLTEDESGVGLPRIVELCSKDWGWWRTVTMVLERSMTVCEEMLPKDSSDHLKGQLGQILRAVTDSPKSRRWKLRARVGDRIPWHEVPEEIEHE